MKKIVSVLISLILAFAALPVSAEEAYSYALVKGDSVLSSGGGDGAMAVGSVSKTFAAAVALKLSEEGTIKLDAPVTDYIPEFHMADERYKKITLRMLLDHSSGLYGSTLKNSMLYGKYSPWNHDNILSLLAEQKLKYEPGTKANYCNDGFSLLEIAMERAAGKDYSALLNEYVTSPLGLGKTVTAKDYQGDNKDIVSALAAGGTLSDAKELSLFGNALFSGFLNEDSLAEMTKSRFFDDGRFDFGLGLDDVSVYPFDKYGIKALAKDGDTLGTSSSLVILPDYNISAAVIREKSSSVLCRNEAIGLIINYLKEENIADIEFYDMPMPERADKADISDYKKCEGLYVSTAGEFEFSISRDYGILKDLYRGTETKYEYIGNGNFAYKGEILSFDGNVLCRRGTAYLNQNDRYLYNYEFAERKEDGEERNEKWKSRNGKSYFVLDEAADSAVLSSVIPKTNVYFVPGVNSYMGYMRIDGDDSATSDITLSGSFGRDVTDLYFSSENGTEFVRAQGWTFVDSDSIPEIYGGYASYATIGDNGFIKWYKIGASKGKIIEAEFLIGSVTVYDASGKVCFSSLSGEKKCTLPEGGYIAFAGDAGTRFDITLN